VSASSGVSADGADPDLIMALNQLAAASTGSSAALLLPPSLAPLSKQGTMTAQHAHSGGGGGSASAGSAVDDDESGSGQDKR
jgi:hypothetical protein